MKVKLTPVSDWYYLGSSDTANCLNFLVLIVAVPIYMFLLVIISWSPSYAKKLLTMRLRTYPFISSISVIWYPFSSRRVFNLPGPSKIPLYITLSSLWWRIKWVVGRRLSLDLLLRLGGLVNISVLYVDMIPLYLWIILINTFLVLIYLYLTLFFSQ